MTDHNPYAEQLAQAQKKAQQFSIERRRHADELSWFSAFNGQTAHTRLSQFNRQADKLHHEIAALENDIESSKAAIRQLEPAVDFGFDPRYWFSSERTAAKEKLEKAKVAIDLSLSKHTTLKSEVTSLMKKMSALQADLDRYRAFDSLQSEAAIRTIDQHFTIKNSEIEGLTRLKNNLDDQLKTPLADLQAEQREETRLMIEINRAEFLERRLNSAANGKERALIHQQCSDEFQDRSPSKVVNNLRYKLEPVQRRIKKQIANVDLIVFRATRDVRSIVVDGNNMCYYQQRFIGLTALEAITPRLSERYKTIIVFDSGIRGMLKMRDKDIQARFGSGVEIHVVATATSADETILAIAEPEKAMYVLSNDRFDDFKYRRAVSEKRIMRHEIVNNSVHIHELGLSANFLPMH